MGNSESTGSQPSHRRQHPESDPDIIRAFHALADSGKPAEIHYAEFKNKFGEALSPAIWGFLLGALPGTSSQCDTMTLEQFATNSKSLVGMPGTDLYVRMFESPRQLLKACFQAAGLTVQESDAPFIESLIKEMVTDKRDVSNSIIAWKNSVCPGLCQDVQQKVIEVFTQIPQKKEHLPDSTILSPVQVLILKRCLPTTVYSPRAGSSLSANDDDDEAMNWIRLYSSAEQGISVNRFETNAFDYKGATVSIFRMLSGNIYCIGADQEWRHSVKKFGGPNSTLLQLHPNFSRIDAGDTPPIYCNFKQRSNAFGLSFAKSNFSTDGEFGNVDAIEVWGCSGEEALQEQQKQKLWLRRQTQKHAVVPRNWDDNPDKAIMEMAGFTFSTEREHRPPEPREE